MILTQEEQATLDALLSQTKTVQLIEKFFIRPFENLPDEYRGVHNEELGAQVKAHLTARLLNRTYLHELKTSGSRGTTTAPIAPE